jgi:hypothetical protein
MHSFHRPPHGVPTNKASSVSPLRIAGLSTVTLFTQTARLSENQAFILGFVLDLFTAPRFVRLRMEVVEARRHQILRRRISLQCHGHLLQHSFRQSTTETIVLDLFDRCLRLDIRIERGPRNPVHDQLSAGRSLHVDPQKLGEEIFKKHLQVATGEVGYHHVDDFVAESLILQDACGDVKIAQLREQLGRSE